MVKIAQRFNHFLSKEWVELRPPIPQPHLVQLCPRSSNLLFPSQLLSIVEVNSAPNLSKLEAHTLKLVSAHLLDAKLERLELPLSNSFGYRIESQFELFHLSSITTVAPTATGAAVISLETRRVSSDTDLLAQCQALKAALGGREGSLALRGVAPTEQPLFERLNGGLRQVLAQQPDDLFASELLALSNKAAATGDHAYIATIVCMISKFLVNHFALAERLGRDALSEVVFVLFELLRLHRYTSPDLAFLIASVLCRCHYFLFPPNAPEFGFALTLADWALRQGAGGDPERKEEFLLTCQLMFARVVAENASAYGDLPPMALAELGISWHQIRRVIFKLACFDWASAPSERNRLMEKLARVDIGYALLESNVSESPANAAAGNPNDYESSDEDAALLEMRALEFLTSQAHATKRIAPTAGKLSVVLAERAMGIQKPLYGISDPQRLMVQSTDRAIEYLAGRASQFMLFLRGFRSEKRWFLDNRVQMFSPWIVPITPEPAVLSLEATLQRVLGTMFQCFAIGGRQDIIGMGRIITPEPPTIDQWKQWFELWLKRCDFIMLVPEDSIGLNWEVEQLLSRKLTDRLVLIMLPATIDAQIAAAWSAITRLFKTHGHTLPDYAVEGGFVVRSAEGTFKTILDFESIFDGRLTHEMERRFGKRADAERG